MWVYYFVLWCCCRFDLCFSRYGTYGLNPGGQWGEWVVEMAWFPGDAPQAMNIRVIQWQMVYIELCVLSVCRQQRQIAYHLMSLCLKIG